MGKIFIFLFAILFIFKEDSFAQILFDTNRVQNINPSDGSEADGWNYTYLQKYKAIDFDGDGDLDLFTGPSFLVNAGNHFYEVKISLNKSGSLNFIFNNYFSLFLGSEYEILGIEDINQDGFVELFLGNTSNNFIEVYSALNHDNIFYETPLLIRGYNKLGLLDYDLDGFKDFVVGATNGFSILRNPIDFRNNLTSLYEYNYTGNTAESGTIDITIADFNNDGKGDIFNGTTFFLNLGNIKGFTSSKVSLVNDNTTLISGLSNPLLSNYKNDNNVHLFGSIVERNRLNSGDSTVYYQNYIDYNCQNQQYTFPNNVVGIESFDLDNDGLDDKITVFKDSVYYTASSNFQSYLLYVSKSKAHYISKNNYLFNAYGDNYSYPIKFIGDINSDGQTDILIQDQDAPFPSPNGRMNLFFLTPTSTKKNNPPNRPENVTINNTGDLFSISWNPSTDDNTPSNLLQYNITIVSHDSSGIIYKIYSSDVNANDPFKYNTINLNKANLGHNTRLDFYLHNQTKNLDVIVQSIDKSGLVSIPSFTVLPINYDFFPEEKFYLNNKFRDYPKFHMADLNRDSRLDILVTEQSYSFLSNGGGSVLFIDGKTKQTKNLFPSGTTSKFDVMDLADVNNDGMIDILGMNTNLSKLQILLNSGTLSFADESLYTKTVPIENYYATDCIQPGLFYDPNSNGSLDIFFNDQNTDSAFKSSNNLFLTFLDTSSTWQKKVSKDINILYTFDLNGDGEKDIVTQEKKDTSIFIKIWYKTSLGFSFHQILTEIYLIDFQSKNVKFESFDIDADGTFELIVQLDVSSNTLIFQKNQFGDYILKLKIGRVILFDYDNDALIDYFDLKSLDLFKNYGNWNFSGVPNFSYSLTDLLSSRTSFKPVDYNNFVKYSFNAMDFDRDSLTDILVSKLDGISFYKNRFVEYKNIAPTIPIFLTSDASEDTVSLKWKKSNDPNNRTSGLFYNIEVWEKGTNRYLTPQHSLSNGSLLIENNFSTITNKFVLRSLKDGTYYWKVQSIDQSHLPSPFSVIDSFKVVLKPTLSILSTKCNYDKDTIIVHPPSKNYKWKVSGGVIIDSNESTINVKWLKGGNQKIKISNQKFSLSDSSFINVLENEKPVLQYSFPDLKNPLTVQFETNSNQVVNNYNWKIGDSIITKQRPRVTYNINGTYPVSLIQQYNNGCQNSNSLLIDLFRIKILGNTNVCGISTETYLADPQGFSYNWEVVGGSVLSKINDKLIVNWTQADNQKRFVKLLRRDISFSDSIEVKVFEVPVANYLTPEDIGTNSLIKFENLSIGNITSYYWTFDEIGNSSIEKSPVASFTNAGVHKISLKAKNDYGCENLTTKLVRVSENLFPVTIANLLSPNADGKNDNLYIENLERYPENEIKLYNAWGTEVFSQRGYKNDWDLKKDDLYIPSGNYLCTVELTSFGKKFEKIVTVIR